jgi:hypothetical protein
MRFAGPRYGAHTADQQDRWSHIAMGLQAALKHRQTWVTE